MRAATASVATQMAFGRPPEAVARAAAINVAPVVRTSSTRITTRSLTYSELFNRIVPRTLAARALGGIET